MTRRPALLVLAPLLVLAVLGIYWVVGESQPERGTGVDVAVRRGVSPAGNRGPEASVSPEVETAKPLEAKITGDAGRELLGTSSSSALDLDQATWISGRVRFPAGAPYDPKLAVLAFFGDLPGNEPADTSSARAWIEALERREQAFALRPVEPDGSFQVPHPPGAPSVALLIDGRFLYMFEPLEIAVGDPAPELAPLLGAALRVRARPPANIDAEDIVGARLQLGGSDAGRGGFMGGFEAGVELFTRELGPELEIELGGLVPERTYSVVLDAEVLAPWRKSGIRLEPGRVLTLDAELIRGARLRGSVVDRSGAPVAGAAVGARPADGMARWLYGDAREATTGADGRFELAGVRPARKGVVSARRDGEGEGQSDELELVDGALIEGIEIVLDPGSAVGGVVLGPDGAPYPRARVEVRRPDSARALDTTTSDAQGRFQIGGLENSSHDVVVTSRPDMEGPPRGNPPETATREASAEAPSTGDEAPVQIRPPLFAAARAVAAGALDLELQLAPPPGLSGRVVGPGGNPVTRFSVSAREAGARGASSSATFDSADGMFTLPWPHPGTWTLDVTAPDHIQHGEQEVVVPETEALVIRLERGAGASGIVLDPLGDPRAGARVSVLRGSGGGFFGGSVPDMSASVEADAEGRFELGDLAPGTVELRASHEEWARSEAFVLELVAGTQTPNLLLHLRRGGDIEGLVYDAQGLPDGGRSIAAFTMAGASGSATSDARGEFQIAHLEPGKYQVMAQPRLERMEELLAEGDDFDPSMFLQVMSMASVEVFEGQTSQVVLGAPPSAPVRVHGRVTRGGEAVREGSVTVMVEGRGVMESMKAGRIGADGSYELVLDEPAQVILMVAPGGQQLGFGGGNIPFPVRIPEVEAFRFDIDLPTGSIAGVVLGVEGEPLAGQSVRLITPGTGVGLMDGMHRVLTSATGTFSFRNLRAGTYGLQVGGGLMPGAPGGGSARGTVFVEGIELAEGAAREGITVRLPAAARVEGRVVGGDGRPVSGAAVYARDPGGRLLSSFQPTTSDTDGRFELDGLAPGEVLVLARSGSLTGPEVGPVRVRAGEPTQVELVLETGTLLRVILDDGEGNPVSASVSVRDEHDREQAGILSAEAMQALFSDGFSTTEHLVGPLPSGRYVVTATQGDRSASRTVHLRDQEERVVRLRLRD